MSAPLSSRPPPRRPALAKCGELPEVLAYRDALRQWMRDHDVSQALLAKLSGKSARRVFDWVSGYAPIPYGLPNKLPGAHGATLRLYLDNAAFELRRSAA